MVNSGSGIKTNGKGGRGGPAMPCAAKFTSFFGIQRERHCSEEDTVLLDIYFGIYHSDLIFGIAGRSGSLEDSVCKE